MGLGERTKLTKYLTKKNTLLVLNRVEIVLSEDRRNRALTGRLGFKCAGDVWGGRREIFLTSYHYHPLPQTPLVDSMHFKPRWPP